MSSAPASASASLDPALVERPTLTCGEDRTFPPEALGGLGAAELGIDSAAGALREFLEFSRSGGDTFFPPSGWHRVIDSPDAVAFVAPVPRDPGWVQIAFAPAGGEWQPELWGACNLTIALPPGIGIAPWWIDPASPPDAGNTSIQAFVLERECASGRSAEGRILTPVVVYGSDAIVITTAVERIPGDNDCQGNPPTAYRIELVEPIGARVLLDGGSVPPRPPTPPD